MVTGGAGFIGSHIVEFHLKKGDKVHVVDNLSTGVLDNIKPYLDSPDFHFTNDDILTMDHLARITTWADRIYHFAAIVGMFRVVKDPIGVLATNIAGTERLLRAIDDENWTPQVVMASTSEVYGHSPEPELAEDQVLHTPPSGKSLRWNYAISKLADEVLGLSYFQRKGIKIVVSRLFNTVGPRQTGKYGMVVPRFVSQAVNGEDLVIYGDGEQTRCFIDVRDTVRFLDLLGGNPQAHGEVVNVGYNREVTINQLAEMTLELAGSKSKIRHITYDEAYGPGFVDIARRRPDVTKLARLSGFTPQWSLEDTLGDLIERYRKINRR
ncbi:NAD-dependent epimerase/dehydratase family protein [Desulfoferula mesophila]